MGVLAGDAFTLPGGPNGTVVGSIAEGLFVARAGYCRVSPNLFLVREPGGMRVIDADNESWGELAQLLDSGDTPVATCNFVNGTTRDGVWSHTTERARKGIGLRPLVGDWSAEELGDARQALFNAQTRAKPCWGWLQYYEDVAKQDTSSSRVLWTGVAHDTFALLTLAALLYSFTGWPTWFAAHPWSRRNRRLLRGLCPECGYDTRGLATCPECGTARSESDPSEPRA